MKELLELLEHDARRPVNELASMLHRSEYEVEQDIKKLEKTKEITEDESKRGQESMQKLVDKYVKLADAAKEVKEKEVMEV